MKMFKKVMSVVLCMMMLAGLMSVSMLASAETEVPGSALSDGPDSVEAVRWFPAHPDRHNDYLWEVEFDKEGCMCQSFLWEPEKNYLDITYNEDGSVTFTRNDNGDDFYWPRVRTFSAEDYPLIDMTTATDLHFNFDVAEGTYCNIQIQQIDMFVKLSAAIAKECGVSGVADSNGDLPPGHYEGSINLVDALTDVAAESGTDSSVWGQFYVDSINDGTSIVPSLSIYVVGAKNTASVTMNSLFISTADDTNGDKCVYADAAMVFDKEIAAEINAEQALGPQEEDVDEGEEGDEGDETEEDPDETPDETPDEDPDETPDEDSAAPTTAAPTTTAAAKDGGDNGAMLWIIIAIAAVVVIGGAVAAVIIINKKKA